mgnify:CR=1 FL=1
MWHTTEIVKIFEKITEDYGYEIYQNRKRCAALCSDLLVEYSTEKNIMQMRFLRYSHLPRFPSVLPDWD